MFIPPTSSATPTLFRTRVQYPPPPPLGPPSGGPLLVSTLDKNSRVIYNTAGSRRRPVELENLDRIGVAQLVAHRLWEPGVAGSSPAPYTIWAAWMQAGFKPQPAQERGSCTMMRRAADGRCNRLPPKAGSAVETMERVWEDAASYADQRIGPSVGEPAGATVGGDRSCLWARSSNGRAAGLHPAGCRFKSCRVHHAVGWRSQV